jgi:hypothetical protein
MSPERAGFLSEGEKSEGRIGVDFPRRGKSTCFEPPARAFRFASGWPSPPTRFALVLKSGTDAVPPTPQCSLLIWLKPYAAAEKAKIFMA